MELNIFSKLLLYTSAQCKPEKAGNTQNTEIMMLYLLKEID